MLAVCKVLCCKGQLTEQYIQLHAVTINASNLSSLATPSTRPKQHESKSMWLTSVFRKLQLI